MQTLHGTSIGIGGSVTIDTLGVYDRLCESNEVFWHWKNHAPETRERAGKAETYLCSANGVSENGEIDRARNIAAPLNARRLNRHTPCAVGEPRCHDCRSPEKVCGVMTVFFMPPTSIKEFHVILVNEDLGY